MARAFDRRPPRLLLAALGATALCLFFGTRVFMSFDSLRVKLVKVPIAASEGAVLVGTAADARAAGLGTPVAVITVLRNTGRSPEVFTLRADGQPVCDVQVAGGATARADCVISRGWTTGPAHTLLVTGVSSDWSLDSLEIATHHGSSSRLVSLLVLPDVTASYVRPGVGAIVLAWVALVVLLAMPAASGWPPGLTIAHRVLAGISVLLLLAVTVSPWLTPFLVLLSVGTFVKISILVAAPQLFLVLSRSGQAVQRSAPQVWRSRRVLVAGGIALAVLAAYGIVIRQVAAEVDGRISGLLRVSERVFDSVPLMQERPEVRPGLVLFPDNGYDAQFHYFALFDPLMRQYSDHPRRYRDVADAPPYRFGRIGFPWLTRAIAGSRWEQYPAVMVALVWLGIGLSTLALALIALQSGRHPAWGLLVLAIPGFWQSVRVTLPEPLAAGLFLLGYWCVRSRRVAAATALLAASLLIRETGVLLVLAIALLTRASELSWRGRAAVFSALVPLAAWRGYVCWVLWPDWGWQGLFYSPHSLGVPFAGLMELWSTVVRGTYHPGVPEVARAAIWYPALLLGAAAVALALVPRVERALGGALVLYTLLAISLSYPIIWVHVGNGQRASFEIFVMLAIASVRYRDYPRPLQWGLVAVWAGAGLYLLYGAFDAASTRGALLPWI